MEDIQALYDEFEEFCTKYCGLTFDEFSIYQRKKLGHYFDARDEYFKLWLNAKHVYSKDAGNATSYLP
ncbi:hypothetical protein BS636_13550 [Acinetobacter sp. LoGeW2-3]|uniref:hypothetical protein n=1 Tax=Acinetobacter sp. LoGeW2-3 TaxID=1808001 RepID=UPI000C05B920|nr:hypothetical protein [Acinetobacter sp. LoGeW2-3]ATO20624.1 hypothetical protein BS636_13550 [Acinetobacter sp. LoGeW2-3]